jgi:hypothetical protein
VKEQSDALEELAEASRGQASFGLARPETPEGGLQVDVFALGMAHPATSRHEGVELVREVLERGRERLQRVGTVKLARRTGSPMAISPSHSLPSG